MKIINKDDSNDNDGSGNNTDNDVIDYGDNHGDSYSNHHEICNDKHNNDDDNSDNNDQIINARISLHVCGEDFRFKIFATFFEIYSSNDSPWNFL